MIGLFVLIDLSLTPEVCPRFSCLFMVRGAMCPSLISLLIRIGNPMERPFKCNRVDARKYAN